MVERRRFEDRLFIHMTPYSNHVGFVDQLDHFLVNILIISLCRSAVISCQVLTYITGLFQ